MPIDADPPDLPASPSAAGPVIEGVAADQAVAHASDSTTEHGPFHTHCENCGTALQGPFCHRCGQHDFEFHRSFWHVLHDALENFFHFDAKLFRNIVALLFSPGRLTAEFNAGKRASQMPPFRLYIFVSLLFFFIVFLDRSKPDAVKLTPGKSGAELQVDGKPATINEVVDELKREAAPDAAKDSSPGARRQKAPPGFKSTAEEVARRMHEAGEKARKIAEEQKKLAAKDPDQRVRTIPFDTPDGVDAETARTVESFAKRAQDPAVQRQMGEAFITALPKMLLLCLPVFALLTRVLFRKSRQVYLQHLVVALHFHTFIYLWWLTTNGWQGLLDLTGVGLSGFVRLAYLAWLVVYPFLMMRRLFANSWPKTILKTGLLGFAYLMTLALAFALTAVILVYFLF